MECCTSFNKVKAALREKKVAYALNFPAILKIKHNGIRHRFTSHCRILFFCKEIPERSMISEQKKISMEEENRREGQKRRIENSS